MCFRTSTRRVTYGDVYFTFRRCFIQETGTCPPGEDHRLFAEHVDAYTALFARRLALPLSWGAMEGAVRCLLGEDIRSDKLYNARIFTPPGERLQNVILTGKKSADSLRAYFNAGQSILHDRSFLLCFFFFFFFFNKLVACFECELEENIIGMAAASAIIRAAENRR